MKMVKVSRLDIMEDFPNRDEAYAIITDNNRFAFVWGSKYPYMDELPLKDIKDGENGIEWYPTEEDARKAMKEAIDAWNR